MEWHSVYYAFEATRLRVTKYRTSTIDVNRTDIGSRRKHPFLPISHHGGRFARNVPSGEERGETDVFAGYDIGKHLPVWFIFSIPHVRESKTVLNSRLYAVDSAGLSQ